MKKHLLLTCLLLVACKKSGNSGLVGSWSGDCKNVNADDSPVPCTVTIGAKQGEIYQIHVEARSAGLSCDLEGTDGTQDKAIHVAAPKACAGTVGSRMAQITVSAGEGGTLRYMGYFNSDTATPLNLHGDLTTASAESSKEAGKAASEPSAPSAPPPSAAPPGAAPPGAPPPAPKP